MFSNFEQWLEKTENNRVVQKHNMYLQKAMCCVQGSDCGTAVATNIRGPGFANPVISNFYLTFIYYYRKNKNKEKEDRKGLISKNNVLQHLGFCFKSVLMYLGEKVLKK